MFTFQMDKFLSGFGMSGLMNAKAGGGGDNSSTASPVDSRSNSPKPPSSSSPQSAKVWNFKNSRKCFQHPLFRYNL